MAALKDQPADIPVPEDPVDRALLALKNGDFAKAREHMRVFNTTHVREELHYKIEGLAALAMADWVAANEIFAAATDRYPENTQFWFNRGLAEENLGKYEKAEASYQYSLKLKPEQGETFGNLSNVYRKLGRFPEAIQMACRALAAGVPKAHALNILGLALGKSGNFAEAQKAFDEALGFTPKDGALLVNRANLAIDQLEFEEAWKYFAAAREADDNPVIERDEGMARLLAGHYTEGLKLYEKRLEISNALRVLPSCSRWQGEPLTGKTLMLVAEQGYGDTIQFSRYANRLVEKGANLVWVVRRPLQKLLAANVPGKVLLETDPLPQTDFWLPILSIPYALGFTKPEAPTSPKFTAPAEPKLPTTTDKMKIDKKIGIVWRGSKTHERDHERSLAPSEFEALWNKIDAQYFAPFPEAEDDLDGDMPIVPLQPLIKDFADMAALIAQLDCLITVDTAAAHLAGALNIPTYLLLPHCPDWRWGITGETTAWYPSLTLLRQPTYGDWDSVMDELIVKLRNSAA